MPYYEVIYETGNYSISHDDEANVISSLKEHHKRARSGLPGGPAGAPAERIARVLKYKVHPGTYGESQTMTVDGLKKVVADLAKQLADENGVVRTHDLTQALLLEHNAVVENSEPLESNFKMQEVEELDPKLWEGDK